MVHAENPQRCMLYVHKMYQFQIPQQTVGLMDALAAYVSHYRADQSPTLSKVTRLNLPTTGAHRGFTLIRKSQHASLFRVGRGWHAASSGQWACQPCITRSQGVSIMQNEA
jgi:hypothetical protein